MRSVRALQAFNFLYFSQLAIFISFLPVYMDIQGVSVTEIGVVMGTGGIIGVIAQPMWGIVSDKARTIKRIITLVLSVTIAIGLVLYHAESFLLLLFMTGFMYLFLLPVDPLTESLNVQTAEKHGVSYGAIRTYGAAGYAVTSLAVGYVMQQFGAHSLAYVFGGIGLAAVAVVLIIEDARPSGTPVTFESLKTFLTYRRTIGLWVLIFLTALPHRINDSFLGIYIKSLGGDDRLVGQAWFLTTASEIAVFALSFWWLRKGNELKLMTLAAAVYGLRFFAASWLSDPQWIAYVQLLQAFTFPIFYSAAIQYLYRIVPEAWRATGQTMLAVLFFGISGIVASYLGGWLFETMGGSNLYLLMSGLSGLAFVYSLLYMRQITNKKGAEPE